jgi:iron(III) transport system ATP-binding protein
VTSPNDAFVKVENLVKAFGPLKAVDGVSLDVAEKHTLSLLGPSGCGKTTILRCLGGLERPDSGRIEIAGKVVFDSARGINLAPEERQLGIVFQSYAVWPHMSVAENVGFPLKVRRIGKAQARERVARMLDLVGLGAMIDKPATQLSGGQQQRVALARALVHEPRLVLFDEPMSNLDAQLREQVRIELKILQERLGFTAIYVTHDQSEAFALAEQVIIMNRGRIDAMGPPKLVFDEPRTPFVARFLGLNVLDGTVGRLIDDGSKRYAEVDIGGAKLIGRVGLGAVLKPGGRACACVRREHVHISAAVDSPANDRTQALKGEVRASSFLGLVEEFSISLGTAELRAIQPYTGKHSGPVQLSIAADDCIVLAAS